MVSILFRASNLGGWNSICLNRRTSEVQSLNFTFEISDAEFQMLQNSKDHESFSRIWYRQTIKKLANNVAEKVHLVAESKSDFYWFLLTKCQKFSGRNVDLPINLAL